jgi:hypothetical protein
MNALQIPSRHVEVSGFRRPDAEDDGVEFPKDVGGVLTPNVSTSKERDALGLHDCKAPIEDVLLEFEIRNPVSQEPTGPLGAFKDRDEMARSIELIGARQPRRAGTDDSDRLPRSMGGWSRNDPALPVSPLDNLSFDLFDRNGLVRYAQNAG